MANKYYKKRDEKSVENEIKQYIKEHGGLCYKIHGGDLYQETGIPDLLVCWGGLFFGIEVKDPQGKPSAIQLAQGARIKKAGGHFIIAKSLQDVIDYVKNKEVIGKIMSMYDKSYCSTLCDQKDCERNLKYNKPETQYYSVTTFDDSNPDKSHKTCKWKIKKG